MGTVRYTTINGEVIAQKRDGVRRQFVPDPLGSTVAMLDNTQTITDTFAYWPYGEVVSRTGTTETPLQYVGTRGYYNDNLESTYVRARYLALSRGNWLTQDPLYYFSHTIDLYIYAKSSPLNYIDPRGLQANHPNPPVIMTDEDACRICKPRKTLDAQGNPTGDYLGTVICNNGKLITCSYYNGPSDCVKACILVHEQSHIRDGRWTTPCDPDGRPSGPGLINSEQSECNAWKFELYPIN